MCLGVGKGWSVVRVKCSSQRERTRHVIGRGEFEYTVTSCLNYSTERVTSGFGVSKG